MMHRSQQSSRGDLPMQPWVLLAVGFLLGQTSQGPAALEKFYMFVDHALVPLYAFLVLAYLSSLVFRKPPPTKNSVAAAAASRAVAEPDIVPVGAQLGKEGEQPLNMTGVYKLVQIENFEAFLEVQGK